MIRKLDATSSSNNVKIGGDRMFEGRSTTKDEEFFRDLTIFMAEAHNMGGDQETGRKNAEKLIHFIDAKGYVLAKVFDKDALS
ncbi:MULTISPECIES: hypothetical protein [Bacillus]|uniref:hypothetical protein n=1 Tax=Bacillus TaxID=1386 RepID=UPI00119FFD46|nr:MULTISPECIES: hypothetical protein [Bacillus]UTV32028.1 hypothetical protein NM966_14765 [Bacillus altitudinis]